MTMAGQANTSTNVIREGGCFCGAIRYRATGEPTEVNHCHCRMCRRMSGAPVVTWATFPINALAFLRGEPKWFRSSAIAERGFCASCGSQLLWRPDAQMDEVDVTAASLDDPNTIGVQFHIWTENQLDWMTIEDHLPRFRRSRQEG